MDFKRNSVIVKSAFELKDENDEFILEYDRLIIASGAESNTFNVPGVSTNALFLKDINDARRIRHRVLECFEHAMEPNIKEKDRKRFLNFAIVGGGPTGVEFAAELYDFIQDDLSIIYPSLWEHVRITVYDVGKRILGAFDEKLSKFASERFARKDIIIETNTGVSQVERDFITLSTGMIVPVGMTVWATGLAPSKLAKTIKCEKDNRTGRIITDEKLRVKSSSADCYENVYSIGDCSIISGQELPCTAQVAKQQAQYLAKVFNQSISNAIPFSEVEPFRFHPLGMMAYVGGWQAVADMKLSTSSSFATAPSFKGNRYFGKLFSGRLAWLIWRSAYFSMAVSIKNKILIPMYWFLTWIFGRDISKI